MAELETMTELETLKKKCLDEHGEPKDGATHGEIERINCLELQKRTKKNKKKSPSSP